VPPRQYAAGDSVVSAAAMVGALIAIVAKSNFNAG
jgi:hypothetical protein